MPNDPYLDASVRWKIQTGNAALKEPRYREVAEAILEQGLATEVLRAIGSGKEADVYLCRDARTLIAVKVYRTYRTANRVGRAMKLDSIGHLASWEFDLLTYAWRDDAPVPRPIRRDENSFSMQYLGTLDAPAPRLKDAAIEDPGRMSRDVLTAVERLVASGVVHTDLSPYNILVEGSTPWIIDVGKCLRVDRLGSPPWLKIHQARQALEAGAQALARFFRGWDVEIDPREVTEGWMRLIARYGDFEE